MNIGDKVTIKECHKIPELVGEQAEVVGIASEDFAKYPITVKLLSGEHQGKSCVFRSDELEVVPQGNDGIPDIFLTDDTDKE